MPKKLKGEPVDMKKTYKVKAHTLSIGDSIAIEGLKAEINDIDTVANNGVKLYYGKNSFIICHKDKLQDKLL